MRVHTIAGERVVDLTPETDPDWCLDPSNLAQLYRHLRERGEEPDPLEFMQEPWHWTPEWIAMWQEREA